MNNVFLTSQASEVLEKIMPLLPSSTRGGKVVFIPTAATPYLAAPWLQKDKEKLIELGFSVHDFNLENANKDDVRAELQAADIIFVGGGNTFYLLEHAKRSGFMDIAKQLVEEGKVYIGSSAGSVLAAPDIEYVTPFDDASVATLTDTKGLGLVDFRILPHAGNPKYEKSQATVIAEHGSEDSRIIPVKDTEFLLQDGALWGIGMP